MKAMGITSWRLARMVFMESLMLASVALLIGTGIGVGVCLYLYVFPIPMESFLSVFKKGMLRPSITAILNANCILHPVVSVLFISLVSPIMPIWWVAKLTPVKAIRPS